MTISSAPAEAATATPAHAAVRNSTRAHAILLSVTVSLSAFLLFSLEPLFAKLILPWFGGAAAVWATCLVFFQCALLLGYVYAHVSARILSLRSQILTHVLLVAISAVALFKFGPLHSHREGASNPALDTLQVLATSIGLPFLVLASTTPLLQSWYARTEKTK